MIILSRSILLYAKIDCPSNPAKSGCALFPCMRSPPIQCFYRKPMGTASLEFRCCLSYSSLIVVLTTRLGEHLEGALSTSIFARSIVDYTEAGTDNERFTKGDQ